MRVRGLNATGDWTFGKGQNNYKTNLNALIQNIGTRINSFLGDCFFDVAAGIDWLNLIGGKNVQALSIAVSSTIMNTQGVTKMRSFKFVLNDQRVLTLHFVIDTIYGPNINGGAVITNPVVSYILTQSGDVLTTQGGDRLII